MVDEKELVNEVKKKREFSQLPDSIVERALELNGNVKDARAFLRKYFGVFLTNKVIKPKDISDWETVLKSHISSKKRNYEALYEKIFRGEIFQSVVDLGSGVNGFSLFEMHKYGVTEYYGVEASGQIVEKMNGFFDKFAKGYDAHAVWLDLFDLKEVKKIVRDAGAPRAVFCFQVVDALESVKKNFSKEFITAVTNELNEKDIFVLSVPTRSISGRKEFEVNRKWLNDFLSENFEVKQNFEMFDERFIVFGKK